MIDAKEVSAAHRARYFWGNLPGMSRWYKLSAHFLSQFLNKALNSVPSRSLEKVKLIQYILLCLPWAVLLVWRCFCVWWRAVMRRYLFRNYSWDCCSSVLCCRHLFLWCFSRHLQTCSKHSHVCCCSSSEWACVRFSKTLDNAVIKGLIFS